MLLFKKEKEVIELILKHLDLVEQSMKTGITTIEFYLQNNIEASDRAEDASDQLELATLKSMV